ncbi:hypothetical protein [Gimesia maris]|uniref:Uncharacterized protein n=1 Tax=Gimesia maris TaxID=122 RepID=A0ABX5YKC0_9PLAN|nr:hypothetical protein [Gimesia maris]EDL57119.1 hypothetical protein PM8797T_01964 [Gimesia maris DSM 8797]QDU14146.1 hypothetical protein CA11_19500 [Gimesia maris]QEG16166.1 hypothetical protein GmarT_20270 [Gimesia maris]QGQ30609.1 hypothetical protein F1729_19210 [Gimesia maris]
MVTLTSFINDLISITKRSDIRDTRTRFKKQHSGSSANMQDLNDTIKQWSSWGASHVEIHRYASTAELGVVLSRFDKPNGQGISDVVLLLDESLPLQFDQLLRRENLGRRLTLISRQKSTIDVCNSLGITDSIFRMDWEAVEVSYYLKDILTSSVIRLNRSEKLAVLLPETEDFNELKRNDDRLM